MSVRPGIGLAGAVAITMLASELALAEGGRPSRKALDEMGLGSLVVMSDEAALAVRGHGYRGGHSPKVKSSVKVFGNSFAAYDAPNGGAQSENGYFAEGSHKAGGSNPSYAGAQFTKSGGHKGGGYKPSGGYGGGYGGGSVKTDKYFASGHSSGWAF